MFVFANKVVYSRKNTFKKILKRVKKQRSKSDLEKSVRVSVCQPLLLHLLLQMLCTGSTPIVVKDPISAHPCITLGRRARARARAQFNVVAHSSHYQRSEV